jgi:hypothetical protein
MIYERPVTLTQAMEYEVAASWWSGWVRLGWLQDIAGRYFARKARRKHGRYMEAVRYAQLQAAGRPPTAPAASGPSHG